MQNIVFIAAGHWAENVILSLKFSFKHFIEGPVLLFASSLGLFYVVTLSFIFASILSEIFLDVC